MKIDQMMVVLASAITLVACGESGSTEPEGSTKSNLSGGDVQGQLDCLSKLRGITDARQRLAGMQQCMGTASSSGAPSSGPSAGGVPSSGGAASSSFRCVQHDNSPQECTCSDGVTKCDGASGECSSKCAASSSNAPASPAPTPPVSPPPASTPPTAPWDPAGDDDDDDNGANDSGSGGSTSISCINGSCTCGDGPNQGKACDGSQSTSATACSVVCEF
jgi:hypothetical protein